ncbi:OmpA family protein [Flavobacterium sp. JP2137]|uniref:OmpA family protein n=1 Tax=Flavobacterium sp. JP2137 TaxID=3414510 RepID=UPI003D2FE16B
MKITKKYLFGALAIFCAMALHAQEAQERRATAKYENYAYVDAIKIYERVARKGHQSQQLFQNLGNAYYFNGKLIDAANYYAQLFAVESAADIPSEYYYRYAQTLKAKELYPEAAEYLQLFKERENRDGRALLLDAPADYLTGFKTDVPRYTIAALPINSAWSDYGSTLYENQLIFSSAREKTGFSKRIHSWTDEPFTRLYAAEIDAEGHWGTPRVFAPELGSKFNESTPVFSEDGNTVYFTRNNYANGRRITDDKGISLLKIYRSQRTDNRWSEPEELPFNSNAFSSAHPALTADGKWLYFASDRDGSIGQSDLYKVAIHPNGSLGNPINLGPEINTEGRESFPFITADNELYFASDGRPGLGGLDIYVTRIGDDQSRSIIQSIGAPANSPQDDFGFYIDSHSRTGFLSSNRAGQDDIYAFTELQRLSLDCNQSIYGLVYDPITQLKLNQALVTLTDADFNKVAELRTTADGKYEFKDLKCGNRYRINAQLIDYNTAEVAVDLPLKTERVEANFGLEKNRVIIKKGDDLFVVLQLAPIYFDFGKADIRPEAQVELAKICEVLLENPKMVIDVRAHTDSRGNDAYNLKLSDQRARATAKWIVSQGIAPQRVLARGFGETQLLNGCSNGIPCNEDEHQVNRRSEFIILEM